MDKEKQRTPKELIEAFKQMDKGTFLDHKSIAQRVRELSDAFGCRYVPRSTDPSRELQIFACRHNTSIF